MSISNMLAEAAEIASQRQKSKKQPRTYGDYREMLKEKDLDIVLIGTPDHWHALHDDRRHGSRRRCLCARSRSASMCAKGEAMLAAARKHKRVVQVGTQRKSTPHLIEAKKKVVEAGLLGKVGHVEICCYYHMRANGNPPVSRVPDYLDYEMWTGPAPLRPYDGAAAHSAGGARSRNTATASWATCASTCSTPSAGCSISAGPSASPPPAASSCRRRANRTSPTRRPPRSNTTTSTSSGSTAPGATPPDPEYPWALLHLRRQRHAQGQRHALRLHPRRQERSRIHFKSASTNASNIPRTSTEKDIELNAAPATRRHMLDFLAAIDKRGRPIADIEQGHISTASCILANLALQQNRPLTWDAAKGQIANDPDANRLLRRPYRQPWTHPAA